MFRLSIKIIGTSPLCKDTQKSIVSNSIVDSSSFFSCSELAFDQSFSEISRINRSWSTVSALSCLLTTPILRFSPSMNLENYLLSVGAVDLYIFFHLSNRWPLPPKSLIPLPMHYCTRWESAASNLTISYPATSLLSVKCPESGSHILCQLYPWIYWYQWYALVFWC